MAEIARYDGLDPETLARRLGVPRLAVFDSTASTMDDAHGLAAVGAAAGTVVLADRQSAGRGRGGRRWASDAGTGIWLTMVERPNDADALDVLSLRLGVRAARVLDRFAPSRVGLKWPNDLFVGDGKLAGILVEARWKADRLDWVAIGIGINTRAPTGVAAAASLVAGVSRVEVVAELVPALRAAAAARGRLTARELEEFAARDLAAGRECDRPVPGRVRGITADGALVIATPAGERTFREGSLSFAGAPR